MLTIREDLAKRLKNLRVDIDTLDNNTFLMRNVPVHEQCFSKTRTNILLKRTREGLPFIVFVDEDLQYTGGDPAFARAFIGAHKREGWRVLFFDPAGENRAQPVIEHALAALGVDGQAPRLTRPPASGPEDGPTTLLTVFGENLSQRTRDGDAADTVGRAADVEDVASTVLRYTETRMPIIVGPSGVGKTNLIKGGIARRLLERRPAITVIHLDLADVFAGTLLETDRSNLCQALLKEAAEDEHLVVALEHVDLVLSSVAGGAFLLAKALDARPGVRLIGTTLPKNRPLFQAPLVRRLHRVMMTELDEHDTLSAVLQALPHLAAHHQVDIDQNCAAVSMAAARTIPGCLPGKAIALLDAAAARAALAGTRVVGPDDVYFAAGRCANVDDDSQT